MGRSSASSVSRARDKHLARVAHEVLEHAHLGRGHRHGHLPRQQLPAPEVEPQRPDHQGARPGPVAARLAAAIALQHGLDPGRQLQGIERLRQVVVGAAQQADDPLGLVAPGRQHDDRQIVVCAQALQHLEAADPGQHDVQHHEIGRVRGHPGQRRFAVVDRGHAEALQFQELPEHGGQGLIVVHQQQPGCARRAGLLHGSARPRLSVAAGGGITPHWPALTHR